MTLIPVFLLPPEILIYLEVGLLMHEAWSGELETGYLLQALYVFSILSCWLATVVRLRSHFGEVLKLQRKLNSQRGRT